VRTEAVPFAEKRKGKYFGTEINETWYRRYRHEGWLARGNGEWWIAEQTFFFHRYLTRSPLLLPLSKVHAIKLGSWHAGQWAMGRRILKFLWMKDGSLLSSGFLLTRHARDALTLKAQFEQMISAIPRCGA